MAEHREAAHAQEAIEIDREINVRGIVLTAVGLVVVVVLSCLAMWGLFVGVRKLDQDRDRPISPLPEARERHLPPVPRLQADPKLDMKALRDEEERLLSAPEWVDRQRGTARIPIDLAMDVLARRGLPATPAISPAAPGQPAAPAAAAPSPPPAGGHR